MTLNHDALEKAVRAASDAWLSSLEGFPQAWEPIVRAAILAYHKTAWRPIEEAPKDGTPILAWRYGWRHPKLIVWYGDWHTWMWHGVGARLNEQPTHFQPLPPPPEE